MVSTYRRENVRTIISEENGSEYATFELRGLSTDTKPTEVGDEKVYNGSTFIEIDTGKIFMFDMDSDEWKEI